MSLAEERTGASSALTPRAGRAPMPWCRIPLWALNLFLCVVPFSPPLSTPFCP